MLELNKIYRGDCQDVMQDIDNASVDCIITDPPYGLSFMGKNWDKAVPSVAIWQECLRVLKPGAFAFVMCIPRQDCLARMICRLEDAGFNISFSSVLHTFASGFPKAASLSKQADKRAGVEREVVGTYQDPDGHKRDYQTHNPANSVAFKNGVTKYNKEGRPITAPATKQAKALEGAYSGMQLKPAVEIVIVAMKPLSERTYVDQALKNGHGCTWLDDCRIPYENKESSETVTRKPSELKKDAISYVRQDEPLFGGTGHYKGRVPANVLCEDNVLNDGRIIKPSTRPNIEGKVYRASQSINFYGKKTAFNGYPDKGDFSRYFSLDVWFAERIKLLPKEAQKTFPWLIIPKASKSEKNRGLEDMKDKEIYTKGDGNQEEDDVTKRFRSITKNSHPTVKPIKLMSWVTTLGSREGDIVLDPFCGSGTTLIAAKMRGRQYIGIEKEEEYCEIARKRIAAIPQQLDSFNAL